MAYLTVAEYIARFGEAETVRLTDTTKSGTVDTARVEAAINDASEEADAYIGKRYSTPLSPPPNLVKSIVAAIAREDLYRTRPTDAVTKDAARARAQLHDIARGLMILPSETGPVPEDARPVENSAASGDAIDPVFTESNLAGFGVAPSSYGARWRQ